MKSFQNSPESVGSFLECAVKIARELGFENDEWGPWYRGQQRTYWGLCPRLYTEFADRKSVSLSGIEDEICEEFLVRAPIFSETTVPARSSSEWEWYFLMQHFGTPTRLLDWTEGALLALYFAVRDNLGFYDAAVWVLDPYELNKTAVGREEVNPPSAAGVDPKLTGLLARWLPRRFKKGARIPRMPVAVLPTHTVRRISTQRSCFTVHGNSADGLNRLLGKPNSGLRKIVIPGYAAVSIRKELDRCGIDEATIFPDLEGLSRSIAARWREDTSRPDAYVYTRLRPSRIHVGGVGVFAIRNIPKGTELFVGENEEMLWVEDSVVAGAKGELRRLYSDFAVRRNGRFGCPQTFNRLTMAWYLNEPKRGIRANVSCDQASFDFKALRDIKKGEELTVDYSTYNDIPAHSIARPAES